MDYFRTDCIKSYFELVALVNKGNRVINEQTEAKFFINDKKLFLGINDKQKICLSIKSKQWYVGANSGHVELERFLCRLLNGNKTYLPDLNSFIKAKLFGLSD